MDISLIIPLYNDTTGIKNLLKSIEDGIYFKEIIIVDDKSSESEVIFLNKYVQDLDNIIIVKNRSEKKGAGVCRNIGVAIATSTWIMFADSDDHFLQDYYKILIHYMEKDSDIVFFPPISTDENGEIGLRHITYMSYFQYYWENNMNEERLRYKLEVVWSRLIKHSFVVQNNLKFDEIISSNDKYFAISMGVFAREIMVSPNTIYSWNYRSNSLTTKITKSRFEDTIDVAIRTNNLLKYNLPYSFYKRNTTNSIKLISLSLFRNKFGFFYTFKLFMRLIKNRMPLFNIEDIKRIRNFIRNNKYYVK